MMNLAELTIDLRVHETIFAPGSESSIWQS